MRVVRRPGTNGTGPTVRELMAHTVVCGDPRESLVKAAARMRTSRVSAVAILDGLEVAGILTERDLMRAIADGRDPSAAHVSEYMTASPRTIDAGEHAAVAASVMVKHHIRHLPVTEKGRLVGFLSVRDLLAMKPWPAKLPIAEHW